MLVWGTEWVPYGQGWAWLHPKKVMGMTNQRDFTDDRFQMKVPLFTHE